MSLSFPSRLYQMQRRSVLVLVQEYARPRRFSLIVPKLLVLVLDLIVPVAGQAARCEAGAKCLALPDIWHCGQQPAVASSMILGLHSVETESGAYVHGRSFHGIAFRRLNCCPDGQRLKVESHELSSGQTSSPGRPIFILITIIM
jgi:hypothetical protein